MNPCQNGGTCTVGSVGQALCSCPIGFTGLVCNQTIANCFCQNGGRCNGNNRCICLANFYGTNCEFALTSTICSRGDVDSDRCRGWRSNGFCSFSYTFNNVPILIYCPISCNVCNDIKQLCQDSQRSCEVWARLNFCDVVNRENPNLCRRSCGLCGQLTK